MKLVMCSVFDKAVGAYAPPFSCRARGEAIRMVADEASRPESSLHGHPDDFELYVVAEFSQEDGSFESVFPPVLLSRVRELVPPAQ